MAGPSARDEALRILLRVEGSRAHASSLLRRLPPDMPGRERGLATELVLGTLRWQAKLDFALGQFCHRPLARLDAPVRASLRIAAHQILHLDRIPARAAVDEAVRVVRRVEGRSAAGFANAVLRALCRGPLRWPGPAAGTAGRLAVVHSHPEWLVRRWLRRLGPRDTEEALRADNRPPPVTLRVNRRRGDREALRARLAKEGLRATPGLWSDDALRLVSGSPRESAAFAEGEFYLQDEASQLVSRLVPRTHVRRLADLCAAPGGKATDLACRLDDGTRIVAADRSRGRLGRLRENLRRLGLQRVALLVQDSGVPALRPGSQDAVLVDAPCTGTGVLRRQPEIRWRRREEDLPRMAAAQERLLEAAGPLLRPGGCLVYSVCSLEPEEGPELMARFLRRHPAFRILDPGLEAGIPEELVARSVPGPHLRTLPHRHDIDGFFAIALSRAGR